MIPGAFTPTIPPPAAVATTHPRVAARLYAGAVDATPTTTLDSRPSTPPLSPLPTGELSAPDETDWTTVTAHLCHERVKAELYNALK